MLVLSQSRILFLLGEQFTQEVVAHGVPALRPDTQGDQESAADQNQRRHHRGGIVRAETGPVQFGEDWPGIHIRGDSAFGYAMHLKALLADPDDFLAKVSTESLIKLLLSADIGDTAPKAKLLPYAECLDKTKGE